MSAPSPCSCLSHVSYLPLQLLETVESGLEDNEFVTLLSWVLNTYLGPELMGHPSLGLNVHALPPLLKQEVMDRLINKYITVSLMVCTHTDMLINK